ncbi:hypothetical protein U9M48_043265 [Paspalum notatum var. saurae]|uniref:Uncharacterized protein n=1 Tax=Paspalum notatum var. saurae TaxID=547442 RepID=A0AAQ3XIG1_PASNO
MVAPTYSKLPHPLGRLLCPRLLASLFATSAEAGKASNRVPACPTASRQQQQRQTENSTPDAHKVFVQFPRASATSFRNYESKDGVDRHDHASTESSFRHQVSSFHGPSVSTHLRT